MAFAHELVSGLFSMDVPDRSFCYSSVNVKHAGERQPCIVHAHVGLVGNLSYAGVHGTSVIQANALLICMAADILVYSGLSLSS